MNPNETNLTIAALQQTSETLTARNQFLETGLEDAGKALEDIIRKPAGKCTIPPERAKRLRDAYTGSQFSLSQTALHTIIKALEVAQQRPLTEIQERLVLKYLHSEVMRGSSSVARAASKGLDFSYLNEVTDATVEEWISNYVGGDQLSSVEPEKTHSNS